MGGLRLGSGEEFGGVYRSLRSLVRFCTRNGEKEGRGWRDRAGARGRGGTGSSFRSDRMDIKTD